MFHLSQQIKHFFRANSRHGTHSPFVYALADQAIYRSSAAELNQVQGLDKVPLHYQKVLLRMLMHCRKEKVYAIQEVLNKGDVLFIQADQLSEKVVLDHLSDSTILVVDGIYQSKRERYAWQCARQLPQVTVSLDLFHFGVLISRSGQVKEHFTLRYPFWVR